MATSPKSWNKGVNVVQYLAGGRSSWYTITCSLWMEGYDLCAMFTWAQVELVATICSTCVDNCTVTVDTLFYKELYISDGIVGHPHYLLKANRVFGSRFIAYASFPIQLREETRPALILLSSWEHPCQIGSIMLIFLISSLVFLCFEQFSGPV